MKHNKFFQTTLILVIGGFITKILGFIIRIIYTRMVGEAGISLYTIVMPSYSLLITIATLALPLSISKLVAERQKSSQKIIVSSTIIIILVNLIIIALVFLGGDYVANTLLKEPRAKYLFFAMALTFPFISLSSILKGYFYGKQKMMPNAISNIIEQIVRIVLLYLFIPKLILKSAVAAVMGLILMSIFSELASIFTFLFFLPKNFKIKKQEISPDLDTCKDILNISLPTVSSRLIGNIGFFFEPIILTNLLLYTGFSQNYILLEYGIYNAYSISLLTMPAFFIMAISSSLVPELSKYYSQRDYKTVKRRFKQAMIISFLLGISFSLGILLFREKLLLSLYQTTKGSNYIKLLAPVFVLFYLEGTLTSTLQSLGKAKKSFKITFWGVILKLTCLTIFALFNFGIYALVYSEIINIIFVVLFNFYYIKKDLYSL